MATEALPTASASASIPGTAAASAAGAVSDKGGIARGQEKTNRLSWYTRLYIPAILQGMGVSMRQFFKKPVTINYPEHRPVVSERFRGEHRLTKDADGKMKCVACYMCATACPAVCITIEAQAAPPTWENRDKIPKVFEIDMLKCIYCGYCVEACPKEAIEMTNKIPRVYDNRQDFIYGLDKLLNN